MGVPLRVAVPSWLSLKLTLPGKEPASVKLGVGYPVVTTVNDPGVPINNVALFALVMAGAWFTVRVKVCVTEGPTPFCAVMLMVYMPLVVGIPLSVPVPS